MHHINILTQKKWNDLRNPRVINDNDDDTDENYEDERKDDNDSDNEDDDDDDIHEAGGGLAIECTSEET